MNFKATGACYVSNWLVLSELNLLGFAASVRGYASQLKMFRTIAKICAYLEFTMVINEIFDALFFFFGMTI